PPAPAGPPLPPRSGTSAPPPLSLAPRQHRSDAAFPARARRHGGLPPRLGGTTSPARPNSAAACRPWRKDRRPPPPPPDRRRVPHGAARTHLRSGSPALSRPASTPC